MGASEALGLSNFASVFWDRRSPLILFNIRLKKSGDFPVVLPVTCDLFIPIVGLYFGE